MQCIKIITSSLNDGKKESLKILFFFFSIGNGENYGQESHVITYLWLIQTHMLSLVGLYGSSSLLF